MASFNGDYFKQKKSSGFSTPQYQGFDANLRASLIKNQTGMTTRDARRLARASFVANGGNLGGSDFLKARNTDPLAEMKRQAIQNNEIAKTEAEFGQGSYDRIAKLRRDELTRDSNFNAQKQQNYFEDSQFANKKREYDFTRQQLEDKQADEDRELANKKREYDFTRQQLEDKQADEDRELANKIKAWDFNQTQKNAVQKDALFKQNQDEYALKQSERTTAESIKSVLNENAKDYLAGYQYNENDYLQKQAKALADRGFYAEAADLLQDAKTSSQNQSYKLANIIFKSALDNSGITNTSLSPEQVFDLWKQSQGLAGGLVSESKNKEAGSNGANVGRKIKF